MLFAVETQRTLLGLATEAPTTTAAPLLSDIR